MTSIEKDILERADAALEGVTPGPWRVEVCSLKIHDIDGIRILSNSGEITHVEGCRCAGGGIANETDANFMADARDLVPDLVSALKIEKAEVARLREELKKSEACIANNEAIIGFAETQLIKCAAGSLQRRIEINQLREALEKVEAERDRQYDENVNRIHQQALAENALARASDPDFILAAMLDVADMDMQLADYAEAVAKAIAGLREAG